MALGGPPEALVQIGAFLWLVGCYMVFALGSLRPAFGWGPAAIGYLAIAVGDVLLAFPTDRAGRQPHLARRAAPGRGGVGTVATLVAVTGVTLSTRSDPRWRPWRRWPGSRSSLRSIGMAAGFDRGWAKVSYVVGITMPGAIAGLLMARQPSPESRVT